MISIPGIKAIGKCNLGTLATTPAGIVMAGFRDKATLTFSPYKTRKDYKQRTARNMLQAKAEYETFHSSLDVFSGLLRHMNCNMDVQMLSDKQSSTANSEDVFKFTASTFVLGLAFEYLLTLDGRSIKETLTGAADYSTVQTMLDAADSESAISLGATVDGVDFTQARRAHLNDLLIQAPSGTSLISASEFEDLKFSIKSIDSENALGANMIDGFLCHLEITGKDASISKIVTQLSKNMSQTVKLQIPNEGSYYDEFDFTAGTLTPVDEPTFSDDKRNLKCTYEGMVRPYEITVQTGASYGGVDDDDGANGGTVTIGY